MTPDTRSNVTPRESAVLVPLYRDPAGKLRMVLVRRAEGGAHGGQLGFPGGGLEPGDPSAFDAALREAEEEIGLPRESVELVTSLPAIVTRTTGFRIAPFLVRIDPPALWCPDAAEIAEVLDVRVEDLADARASAHADDFLPPDRPRVMLPYIRVGSYRLWGASHRIVEPLLPRLLAGEWGV